MMRSLGRRGKKIEEGVEFPLIQRALVSLCVSLHHPKYRNILDEDVDRELVSQIGGSYPPADG